MLDRIFLGRYHAVRLLGEGAMGQVYLAQQSNPDRQVVVKVMHAHLAADTHCREAFRREIDFMAQFRHRCAVDFYEASMDDAQGPCLVMDYIDGTALDDLLRSRGRLSPARVARILGDLCSVLHAAHAQGIIHRDLKPSNLMILEPDTENERVKVLDFGLAKFAPAPCAGLYVPLEKFTSSSVNFAVGTPEYICPEQFRGTDMDHRGDLYSVGIMLFELLTGRVPFENKALEELMAAHLHQLPPTFAQRNVFGIAPAVEAVVRACLAKDPADRPQSAYDLATRYEAAAGQRIWNEAEPPPPAAVTALKPQVEEEPADSRAVVWTLEAWMSEQVAALKLRGFLGDLDGEVTESLPGLIRIHLRRRRLVVAPPPPRPGFLARLGLGKQPQPLEEIDLVPMNVYLEKAPSGESGKLLITVQVRPGQTGFSEPAPVWLAWCEKKLMDLSAYLMARRVFDTGELADAAVSRGHA